MKYNRLLSVDPSVTCSGWALFDLSTETLKGVGKVHGLKAEYPFPERMVDIQEKIHKLLKILRLSEGDILICESPTTMKDPSATIKVEQVRCAFESLAREAKVVVPGRINPRSVQFEVLGLKGHQLERKVVKELAVGIVKNLYGQSLKQLGIDLENEKVQSFQDIVDAVLLGHLGIAKIKSAASADVEINEYFKSLQNNKRSPSWRSANISGFSRE